MICYRRGHCLNCVINVVQASIDDRLAKRFEPTHVQHDVIIHDENRTRAVISSIANVGDHSIKRVGEKITATHLDDRTEAAIEGAAPRRFDYISLAAEHAVPLQYSRIAIRWSYFAVL